MVPFYWTTLPSWETKGNMRCPGDQFQDTRARWERSHCIAYKPLYKTFCFFGNSRNLK